MSSAASLTTLIPIAVKAVIASFNTALHSFNVGQRLVGNVRQDVKPDHSWSVCIPGAAKAGGLDEAEVKEFVQQFCESKV